MSRQFINHERDSQTAIPIVLRIPRRGNQRMKGGELPYCSPPPFATLVLHALPEGLEHAAPNPTPVPASCVPMYHYE